MSWTPLLKHPSFVEELLGELVKLGRLVTFAFVTKALASMILSFELLEPALLLHLGGSHYSEFF
jgi:hypothetical protein